MSKGSDLDETVSVSDRGISVEKSFEADEFPVPAIKFELVSEAEEALEVQLTDQIPSDFPMEGIGFHPDFESDNWTAYADHRVVYERELDPGEAVTTVYGIRLDDTEDVADFLTEPTVEPVGTASDAGETVEEVLGEDNNQVIRDVLAGDRDTVPGLDTDDDADGVDLVDGETETDDPGDVLDADFGADVDEDLSIEEDLAIEDDLDADPEADDGPEADDDFDLGEEFSEDDEDIDVEEDLAIDDAESADASADDETADASADDETADAADADAEVGVESPVDESDDAPDVAGESDADEDGQVDGPADESATAADATGSVDVDDTPAANGEPETSAGASTDDRPTPDSGVAAALAAEIRAGEVDDDDLDLLREELDLGVPRSFEVRFDRLRSDVQDVIAYSDALEAFIDENGTGQEAIDGLQTELAEVVADVGEIQDALDDAASDRAGIREDVDDVAADVSDLAADLDEVTSRLEAIDDVAERVDAVETKAARIEELDEVIARIEDLEGELSRLDDLEAATDRVNALDEEMGEVRDDIAALDADVVALETELEEELEAEVDYVEDEIEAFRDRLDELETFRDRLGSAFGGSEN